MLAVGKRKRASSGDLGELLPGGAGQSLSRLVKDLLTFSPRPVNKPAWGSVLRVLRSGAQSKTHRTPPTSSPTKLHQTPLTAAKSLGTDKRPRVWFLFLAVIGEGGLIINPILNRESTAPKQQDDERK